MLFFGQKSGQQCVAMSLCSLTYNIISPDPNHKHMGFRGYRLQRCGQRQAQVHAYMRLVLKA